MSVRKGNLMKEIAQVKSKITDKELFTSWAFKHHLKIIAETVSRRYKRPIQVKIIWDEDMPLAAATNNQVICINANSPLLKFLSLREEKYVAILGLLAHESGHILYTDFSAIENYLTAMKEGKWYPEPPEFEDELLNDNLLKVQEAMRAGKTKALRYAAKQLDNIFEDVYIERELNQAFPGSFREGLDLVVQQIWETMSTIPEMIEKECPDYAIMQNLILSYVRYGNVKDAGYRGRIMDDFLELIPILDDVIGASLSERQMVVNSLLVRLWGYLEPLEDKLPNEAENPASADGTTAIPSGRTRSVLGRPGTPAGGSSDDEMEEKRKETAARLSEEETDDDSEGDSGVGENGDDDVKSSEGGRIPHAETSDISEGDGGGVERDDEYEGTGYEKAASDIARILTTVATGKVSEAHERVRTKDLSAFANSLDYGDAHRGVTFRIHRIPTVNERLIDQYNAIAPALIAISKRLQKQIKQHLKDYEQGGKRTGLYIGKRMDARAIVRDDGRMFYKTNLPIEISQMAVAVLCDESGSMGWGDRVTTARAASIILYDFCTALGIPIMIAGHTESSSVDIYSYAEFDAYDWNDKYRLMDMRSRLNNRDGASLKFVAERLAKRPERFKLLIVISDGQPAASGYRGSVAEQDLRRIKQEYARRGVTTFAAAIGDDKKEIHRIYGDGFLDVTNLNQLPVLLTKLVSRFIKK